MAKEQNSKNVQIAVVMGVLGFVQKDNPLENISEEQLVKLINQWILGSHGERNRQIMIRRLIDGICYEPLSEEFGLSPRHTWNIVEKGKEKILKHIDF